MGYKAAVQILKKADDLKNKVLKKRDLLVDPRAWTDQQELLGVYHQVLVLDLEYALDKKAEQDLWNIGFKQYISQLQDMIRDKKNSRRSDYQALLSWCLEAASGFYLCLLQELCTAFDIDLPFRRRGSVYGQQLSFFSHHSSATGTPVTTDLPQSSSCVYICQYCLVHLGDIARYRNQRKQAENFYKQAIMVSPTSGHPYNQLALLEASQGNKLSTVFYYIRGIAVKNPFPAATTNLLNTLNTTIDKESPLEKVQTKLTTNEFIQLFLCCHAFLHSCTELPQAELCVKSLNATMTALVATQSFTTEKLVKLTAINLYALRHVCSSDTRSSNNSASSNPVDSSEPVLISSARNSARNSDKIGKSLGKTASELTADEKIVREHVLNLLAGSLSAFLVPVHTLKNDESLMDYYALPAVRILMYWIKSEPEVLKESVFISRLQIWPSLCKLLNSVGPYLAGFDYSQYASTPLPEDRSLQGFRPLMRSFRDLDFKRDDLDDKKLENKIRMKRIIEFAQFVTELDINNSKLIIQKEDRGKFIFEPGCIQPDPTNDLLEEMKSFNVSDTLGRGKKGADKRGGGILKPQGSLEKAREEREQLSSSSDPTGLSSELISSNSSSAAAILLTALTVKNKDTKKSKSRTKQNVALQSIFKKIEETNKQVKFKVEEPKKDNNPEKPQQRTASNTTDSKSQSSSVPNTKSTPHSTKNPPVTSAAPPSSSAGSTSSTKTPSSSSYFNMLRTQSFQQNHPAFPLSKQENATQQPSSQPKTSTAAGAQSLSTQSSVDYLSTLRNMSMKQQQQQLQPTSQQMHQQNSLNFVPPFNRNEPPPPLIKPSPLPNKNVLVGLPPHLLASLQQNSQNFMSSTNQNQAALSLLQQQNSLTNQSNLFNLPQNLAPQPSYPSVVVPSLNSAFAQPYQARLQQQEQQQRPQLFPDNLATGSSNNPMSRSVFTNNNNSGSHGNKLNSEASTIPSSALPASPWWPSSASQVLLQPPILGVPQSSIIQQNFPNNASGRSASSSSLESGFRQMTYPFGSTLSSGGNGNSGSGVAISSAAAGAATVYGQPQQKLQSQNDYGKLQKNNHQAGGDMFGSMSWSNFGGAATTTTGGGNNNSNLRPMIPSNFLGTDNSNSGTLNYDGNAASSRGGSATMRQQQQQQQSKETGGSSNRPPMNANDGFVQTPSTTTTPGGYSLFNTNSWTPNLVGQLRNPNNNTNNNSNNTSNNRKSQQENSNNNSSTSVGAISSGGHHLAQNSLFTSGGQGAPQSLAQLLEQQQSRHNRNDGQ